MIVIRQSTIRTTVASGVLVVAFTGMGLFGLFRFDAGQGRTPAIALLGVAGVLALTCVRSITRGTVVAVLHSDGMEIAAGHFARWGTIYWRDIEDTFVFRSIGLQMIGLRLTDPQRYLRRSSLAARASLWVDRLFAAGADAYVSAAAVKVDTMELGRLMRAFQYSPAIRRHFGREDLVLEFPTDVTLADVLSMTGEGSGDVQTG